MRVPIKKGGRMNDDAYQEDDEQIEDTIGTGGAARDESIGREDDMDMDDTDTGFSE